MRELDFINWWRLNLDDWETDEDERNCMSEQLWAIRESLADKVEENP